jgi:tetratricopeptide (TPR) repeat protein
MPPARDRAAAGADACPRPRRSAQAAGRHRALRRRSPGRAAGVSRVARSGQGVRPGLARSGRLHEQDEEWRQAQEAYEQALDALPTFAEASLALADLLRRTGAVRLAIVRLADMLEQDPYDLDALLLLGRALLDDKRNEEALEAFRRVLKFDIEHTGALFYVGATLARLQRYSEAVDAWERVTRIDPAGPFAQRARLHARTAVDLQHIFSTPDAA